VSDPVPGRYKFTIESAVAPTDEDDLVFSRDGCDVVVDDSSIEFVRGATVDFEEEMIRSAFVVSHNPNSESACGCGSSFALKNFEENGVD
jgi:iron-sulfur cluster assembly accessory protein